MHFLLLILFFFFFYPKTRGGADVRLPAPPMFVYSISVSSPDLPRVRSLLLQQQLENSTYKKALSDSTQMNEDRIKEMLDQVVNKQARYAYLELEMHRACQEAANNENSSKEVLKEVSRNKIQQLEAKNCELLSEKALIYEELKSMQEKVMLEARHRRSLEDEILKLKKALSESIAEQLERGTRMLRTTSGVGCGAIYLHRAGKSRDTIHNQKDTISKIFEEAGLPNILALLKSEDLDVQIHAVKVVANLAAEDINQEKIVEEGGLDALLSLLETSESTTIHRVTFGTLANLAMNGSNQGLIMNKGGAHLLANVANRNDDPQTLRMVAGAIANLCGNEKLHVKLEDGGIKVLVWTVRIGHADVIAQIARGIANFAKCESRAISQGHKKGRSLLMDDGALKWMVTIPTTFSASTRRHIELAFCHLSQNGSNQGLIMNKGGARLLANVANKDDDPQTIRIVVGAIANLFGNEKLHVKLKEDGSIKALVGMVRIGHADVIAQIARGIANFAKCESRAISQGHRKGRSLLIDNSAFIWMVTSPTTFSASTRRHIDLAFCHLSPNGAALEFVLASISSWTNSAAFVNLQLYLESLQDLLAPDKANIHIVEDAKSGDVSLPGAAVVELRDIDHLNELLKFQEANRYAANTKVHVHRSVKVKDENEGASVGGSMVDLLASDHVPIVRRIRLQIHDLAASERIDKPGRYEGSVPWVLFFSVSILLLVVSWMWWKERMKSNVWSCTNSSSTNSAGGRSTGDGSQIGDTNGDNDSSTNSSSTNSAGGSNTGDGSQIGDTNGDNGSSTNSAGGSNTGDGSQIGDTNGDNGSSTNSSGGSNTGDGSQIGDTNGDNGSSTSEGKQVGKLFVSKVLIGKGSNGTVVVEGSFGIRKVAVKQVLLTRNDVATKEMELLIESDVHPNIVRFYHIEEDNDFVYIALERCKYSLYELMEALKKNNTDTKFQFPALWKLKGFPSPALIKLMGEIIAGLAHLHGLEIAHRDLKPHNVLISQQCTAKISDMGISKLKLSPFRPSKEGLGSSSSGSKGWRAPEQIKGESQGRAVDLFSLGCTLFYCLTKGKHPFGEEEEREENIKKNAFDVFLIDYIPEAVDLMTQLLHPTPNKRPEALKVLDHPLLWDSGKRISFICDVSNKINKTNDLPLMAADLEKLATKVIGKKKRWDSKLDATLVSELQRFRSYNSQLVRDLLRAIRNAAAHYIETCPNIQALFGSFPGGFDEYFRIRFPNLLVEVYKLVLQYCRAEDVFQKYLP